MATKSDFNKSLNIKTPAPKTLIRQRLKMVQEPVPEYGLEPVHIKSSTDCARILYSLFNQDTISYTEEFAILGLNRANRVILFAQISIGGISGCVVDSKVVFAHAILSGCCSIILAHNHPSGNTQPSQADLDITKKICKGAAALDMQVLDHIILTLDQNNYFSFADECLIGQ